MKSKVIFGSIIGIFTFMLTSFQAINEANYQSLELKTSINLSNTTQNQVSCSKCHDCKRDSFAVLDSINLKTTLINKKSEKNKILVKKLVSDYIETIDFEDENNPDNNKIK